MDGISKILMKTVCNKWHKLTTPFRTVIFRTKKRDKIRNKDNNR